MATAVPPGKPVNSINKQLRVSSYDRVASMIVSLLIFLGTTVLVLFLVFLTQRLMRVQETVPIEYVENVAGRGDHAMGFARDPEPPGAEELEQLEEPQVEQALESVTDAVTSVAANLSAMDGAAVPTTGGSGMGDSRPPGPLGEGDDLIPRSERWQIQYPSSNLKQYARILDFFKIELGVIGGGRTQVEYAAGFSSKPTKRTGAPEQEKRLYMTWRSGEMKQADAELLAKAGVNVTGAIQMQFIPPETENMLAHAEHQALGGRKLKEVQRTVFGVRPKGDGFEFYVIDQRYRAAS